MIVEVARPPATAVLVSDAPDSGNGGGIVTMYGVSVDVFARGVFEPSEYSLSSGWCELRDAARVLNSVAERCAGRTADLRAESLVAAFAFAGGGSQNRGPEGALDLHPGVLDLERTAARHRVVLDVV